VTLKGRIKGEALANRLSFCFDTRHDISGGDMAESKRTIVGDPLTPALLKEWKKKLDPAPDLPNQDAWWKLA
jgi:hypothetical protein